MLFSNDKERSRDSHYLGCSLSNYQDLYQNYHDEHNRPKFSLNSFSLKKLDYPILYGLGIWNSKKKPILISSGQDLFLSFSPFPFSFLRSCSQKLNFSKYLAKIVFCIILQNIFLKSFAIFDNVNYINFKNDINSPH